MRHVTRILPSLVLSFGTLSLGLCAIAAATPAVDAQGKCRDHGKFVEASLCTAKAAPAKHCRDITTKKFAKCSALNTEPVPAKP